jgi:hypothetical protein
MITDREPTSVLLRLAAMTADVARTAGDPKLSVWQPDGSQAHDAEDHAKAMFVINTQYAGCARRIAEEIALSHQLRVVPDEPDAVPFAYFQTMEFVKAVHGRQAICVFGARGVAENLRVVIDLWKLLSSNRLTPEHLGQLARTTTSRDFARHGLQHLKAPLGVFPPPPDASDLPMRFRCATRSGVFLNSEPALVRWWINFRHVSFGFRPDPLLQAVGSAVRKIVSRAGKVGRVTVVNLVPTLTPEFELAKEPTAPQLGLDDGNTRLVSIQGMAGDGTFDVSNRRDLVSPVILLIPIDTYTDILAKFADWLAHERLEVIGTIAFASTAESRMLHGADWHADFMPLVRLTTGPHDEPDFVMNPHLEASDQ